MAKFSLYVHKGGLKPHSFISHCMRSHIYQIVSVKFATVTWKVTNDIMQFCNSINSDSAKIPSLIVHQLEVVSRYRDPQLQVGENYVQFALKQMPL